MLVVTISHAIFNGTYTLSVAADATVGTNFGRVVVANSVTVNTALVTPIFTASYEGFTREVVNTLTIDFGVPVSDFDVSDLVISGGAAFAAGPADGGPIVFEVSIVGHAPHLSRRAFIETLVVP